MDPPPPPSEAPPPPPPDMTSMPPASSDNAPPPPPPPPSEDAESLGPVMPVKQKKALVPSKPKSQPLSIEEILAKKKAADEAAAKVNLNTLSILSSIPYSHDASSTPAPSLTD